MKIQSLFVVFLAGLMGWISPAFGAVPTYVQTYPLRVHFDFAKSDLKLEKGSKAEFNDIALEMNNYPYAKLEIDGHTDIIGPKAFNQKLSEQRALAVKECFVKRYGISPERIVVRGFGETRPTGNNGTSEGRAYNRRAVAHVYRMMPDAAGTEEPTL